MRNQFTFYKSFDDVAEDLSDNQLALYIRILLDVQFLRVKIEDVSFKDKMLNLVWKSQKYSIQTSITGYLDSQKNPKIKNPYLGVYDINSNPIINPSEGVAKQDKGKGQVQGKGKEEEKEEEQNTPFSFTLKKEAQYLNLSKEYKEKLKAKCLLIDGDYERYESFILSLEAKSYKYKDFTKVYMSWDKEKAYKSFKPIPEPMLGDDWYRVKLAYNEIIAINSKTLETKSGTAKTTAPKVTEEEVDEIAPITQSFLKEKGLA